MIRTRRNWLWSVNLKNKKFISQEKQVGLERACKTESAVL